MNWMRVSRLGRWGGIRGRDFCWPPALAGPMASVTPTPATRDSISGPEFRLTGWIAGYLAGVSENWLKVAPANNPAMLEMFRDRDRKPYRDLLPWSGEFAGKHLVSAVQVYRLKPDPELRTAIAKFVVELISLQMPDGYLGPWPEGHRLTGTAVNAAHGGSTWDTWGHYHIMMGLMLWNETSGDPAALDCARRIADLLCQTFATKRVVDIHSTEMNLAPIHALARLYGRTGEARYLRLAEQIRDEFSAVDAAGKIMAGNYYLGPLAGLDFYQLPKPRWESLHSIMGLAELHRHTGDPKAREAFEKIWWSIAQWDRHNNGGFSSVEQGCGNPYNPGAIETCCTIAWCALSVEMLKLTENSLVADELELSLFNSIVGMHSPTGRWSTYNTPMDGLRKASAHEINFQCREGSHELNCCSVNSARGFGLISDWAVLQTPGAVTLNWYGPGAITVPLGGAAGSLTLEQETEYPRENRVRLKVGLKAPAKFALRLRIPHWSKQTRLQLNGMTASGVDGGRYLMLERTWTPGDTITLEFDFALQFWAGEREYAGKVSVYRGPLLLTYDRRYNACDPDAVPALTARGLGAAGKIVAFDRALPPFLLMEFPANDGSVLRLCDFGSAGFGGSPYRSWLEITGCAQTEFSKQNPRRSAAVS